MAASRADNTKRFMETSAVFAISRYGSRRGLAEGVTRLFYRGRIAGLRCANPALSIYSSPTPNNAANCFSPLRVKLTMRLPGRIGSPISVHRAVLRIAAPSVPARWLRRCAPVEAGLAQRPARMFDLGDVDLQLFCDEFLALASSMISRSCCGARIAAASSRPASARRDRRRDGRSRPARGAAPDPSVRCGCADARRAPQVPSSPSSTPATSGPVRR